MEELNSNGVTHILNVTRWVFVFPLIIEETIIYLFFREIDNFFPAVFKYLNIREWDVEETDLLK